MHTDAMNYASNCPQYAVVEGTGRRQKPLLQPIVTERPFQIIRVDIMELPITTQGNRYAVLFQEANGLSHSRPEDRAHCSFAS